MAARSMNLWILAAAALLLSIERIAYIAVWRWPRRFEQVVRSLPGGLAADPVDALGRLFVFFKFLQAAVFAGWCWHFAGGFPWPTAAPAVLVLATLLVGIGQILNFSVFRRLGKVGVFYGTRFGRNVPWCDAFPFNVLNHPQYVGTVLSIWGIFLAMRHPHDDWFVLPLLETAYYVAGSHFEQ